jgi:hypothetical protein
MNHFLPHLLLADFGQVIGAIVMLVTLVLWVVGQLKEGKKQLGQPPRGPAGGAKAPPQPVGGPQQAAGQQPAAGGGLRGEMEEFLRRAAMQAQAQAQRGQGQRAPARPAKPAGEAGRRSQPAAKDRIEVLINEPSPPAERRRLVEPSQPLQERVTSSPQPRGGQPAGGPKRGAQAKRDSVAEHVTQHITAKGRAIAEQASRLGQRIVQDDKQFDVQLKAKFDHDVGSLAATSRVTDTPSQSPESKDTTSTAGLLSAMLSTPEGLRQAFIVNEILRRPSERW